MRASVSPSFLVLYLKYAIEKCFPFSYILMIFVPSAEVISLYDACPGLLR